MWEQWRPHLILMDIRLPDIDGYEVTKKIRRAEEQKSRQSPSAFRTKIIAVTAGGFKEDHIANSEGGCDDFLLKPFRTTDIFDLLHKHLDIEFSYQHTATESAEPPSTVQEPLTPDMLNSLPQDMRQNLKQAVETIDLKKAATVIAQIREYNNPFANSLENLVNNYRFDTLQQFVEKISPNKT
jgi:CheY-like chemotaxis protein